MNKHLYRLIFSKTQQRLVVVSEIATREGKAKGEGGQVVSEQKQLTFLSQGWQLSAVNAGLFSLLGLLFCATASANEMQIRADQSAPKNEQAIILQTANGVPQVNIQTPSAQGVSKNSYSQFDVANQGAILNNSRTNAQTQQGGWVQGNPYLASGEARVIVNQVNSADPSRLHGYVEVAGQRAEVIIANPSGIECQGCGTINANRTTLTTGKVELENGMVKGYQVEQGKVTVSGRGMDTSSSDYTDIIAREAEINAGIWAKELKVTTGKNKVSGDNQTVEILHTGGNTAPNPTGAPENVRYAVDVSELGGMYAGKIHLVGTEDGLGVRNAGHIGATQGNVQIDSQGQIVNTGFVGAQQDVKADAKQQLENRGTVYAQQGDVQMQSQTQGIQQHGSVIAKGEAQAKGKVRLQANGKIAQQGQTFAEGNIDYQAKQIETDKSAVLAAGVRFEQSDNGERKTLNAASENGKSLTLTAEQSAVAQGQNLASGQITVQAEKINLNDSHTSANQLHATARSGDITADRSTIRTEQNTHFITPTALSTQGANLNAQRLLISADRADNRQGVWLQRSDQPLVLDFAGGLNNQAGQIGSAGDILVNSAWLNSQQGVINSDGNLTINTRQGELNNHDGRLSASHRLQLDSGTLNNQGGLIQSGAGAVINTHGQRLDNTNTLNNERNQGIISLGTLEIQAGSLDNQQGYLAAQGWQQVNLHGDLNNRQGEIIALGSATWQAQNWENSHGKLGSNGALTVHLSGDLSGERSTITAQQDLMLTANTLRQSNQSLLHSDRTLQLTARSLRSTENSEISGQQLALQVNGELDNTQSRLLAEQALNITSQALNNSQGIIASLQGDVTLDTQRQQLNNLSGKIQAKQAIALQSGLLDNRQGLIQSGADMRIETDNQRLNNNHTLTNQATTGIISLGKLTIQSADLDNQTGFIASVKEQVVQANQLNNSQGTLRSDGSQRLQLSGGFTNTAGRLLAEQDLQLQSRGLDNTAGLIRSRQNATLDTQNQALINNDTLTTDGSKGIVALGELAIESAVLRSQHGYIASQSAQRINASELDNQQGLIQANANLQLNVNGQMNNAAGRILSEKSLALQSGELNNRSGLLQGKQQLTIDTGNHTLDNRQTLNSELSQGLVTLGELSLKTAALLNQQGAIISAQQQQIRATALQNEHGLVQANAAQTLTVDGELVNRQGQILGVQTDIQAHVLDNSHGKVSANQSLTTKLKGALLNVNGQLISGEANQIQADSLDNQQGTIGSQQAGVTLNLNGELNNQQGRVMANRDVVLSSQQLDNRQGSVNSLANIHIDTHGQALNNQQGNIVAGQTATLRSGELLNQSGLISGQRAVSLDTQGQALDNRDSKGRGIVSNGDVTLRNLSNLDNRQGDLTASDALQVNAQQIDNRDNGLLLGIKDLGIDSTTLDNRAGVIQSAQRAVIVATAAINNSKNNDNGSLIQSGDVLQITTAALDNSQTKASRSEPTQGVIANHLRLNSDRVNNQSGGIYTTTDFDGQIHQTVDNTSGEILSLGSLALQGGELALNNQDGKLESRRRLTLDLDRFIDEGSIKTQGDADIKLKQDLTLTHAFQVDGSLNLSTEGNFYNRTQLITGNGLSVRAQHIDNPFGSELSSQNTQINADSLTNRGLIDGARNMIKAGQLENLGTGRIYGDHLAIQANSLRNDQESVNGETKSATIAARERLDLGVGTLTNRDHALIFSLGDLAIGGQLDADGYVTGKANFIDNGSATIEALGNGSINTVRLWNHDLHLKLGEKHEYADYFDYSPENSSEIYHGRTNRDGYLDWNNNSRRDRNAYFRFDDKNRAAVGSPTWYQWEYTRRTTTSVIEHQDPAKLLIGGDLSLNGDDLLNDSSRLLVGKTLLLNDQRFTQNAENRDLVAEGATLRNKDTVGTINKQDVGESSTLVSKRKQRGTKKVWAHYTENKKPFVHDLPVENFNFNLVDNSIGNLQVVKANASNQQLDSVRESAKTALSGVNISLSAATVQSISANNTTEVTALNPLNTNQVSAPIEHKPENISVQASTVIMAQPSANQMEEKVTFFIKTIMPTLELPQASLYKINPNTDSHVLVETDPQFANRRQWLSSDYMFTALRSDHNNMHKRLGDGFYEQRLINEQVNQLTGRRFLNNYQADYDQYKALMDSGIKYAAQFGLIPGVALSEAQMKELTTDMVWLVNREVRLADGSVTTVLVPQVYIVARDTDVTSRGAVISANQIIANTRGDIENSGVIAGRQLTALSAENIRNLGGVLQGENVLLQAQNELLNLGGSWSADKKLVGVANTIRIESTLSETEDTGEFYKKGLNQLAKVRLNDRNGELILRSQDDITIKGANFDIAGKTAINAGNHLNLGTLTTENKEQYNANQDNYYRLHQTAEVGNQLNLRGGATLQAGQDLTLKAVQLQSDGQVNLIGGGDVVIESGRLTEQLASASKSSSKGLLSKTTEITRHAHDYDTAVGSTLSGQTVNIIGNRDINIKGSSVVGDEQVNIMAGNNIDISADTNRYSSYDYSETKKSGLMGSGGIGFTIGSRTQKDQYDEKGTTQSDARAAVGSLSGNVNIAAGNHVNILGTDLIAQPDKAIDISGKTLKVEAGKDIIESSEKHEFKQSGLTVALSTPVTDAALAARQSLKRSGEVNDSRLAALYQVKAATEAAMAVQASADTANTLGNMMDGTMQEGAVSNPQVKISLSVGSSQSRSTSNTTQVTHSGSEVSAGNIKLKTTEGDIDILGSSLNAKQIALDSAQNINLESVQDTYSNRSDNKNSGWSVGAFIGTNGNSYGFGIEGSAQAGKGHENSDSVTQKNTVLNTDNLTLNSKNDTNIKGAVVNAKRLDGEIGGDLNIESRQDSNHYDSKQVQAGGSFSVTYGSGGGGSVNVSASKGKVNSAQVNEQSGLRVGEEGMNLTVGGNTHLKGGVIDSQATADKNHFSTGTLTTENIENHSEVSMQSVSVGMSTSGPSPMQAIGLAASLAGNVNKSDSATTQSAVSQNINLDVRNGEVPTALSRDTVNANQKVQQFDKAEYQERVEAAQVIGDIAKNAVNLATYEERTESAKLKDRAKDAEKAGNRVLAADLSGQAAALDKKIDAQFGIGSTNGQAIAAVTAVLQGLAGGNAGQAIAGGLSPYVNSQIKALTGDNTEANIVAHALWGAIEAQASGNSALAGATAAASGEVAAAFLTEQLYGKAPKDLTASEKETISGLSQIVGALSSVAVANNSSDGYRGAEVAKSAVENNLLGAQDNETLFKLSEKLNDKSGLSVNEQQVAEYLLTKDSEVNRLIKLNQADPAALTESQKNYLYQELNNIAKSYNISIDELYNWDFSKPSIGRDDSALKNYLNRNNIYANSFDAKVSQGVADGLAVAPGVTGVSTLLGTMPKVATVAQKYPLLTDMTATAVANTGYQLSQDRAYDPYSLLQSELSTVLTRNRTLGQQVSVNVMLGAVTAKTEEELGSNVFGAVLGTVASHKISNFNLGNNSFNTIAKPIYTQAI
ncbi:filamentous hemagglutinin N-terminal domain-containing protein, partial [Pasteurellaceae bacterium Phil11]